MTKVKRLNSSAPRRVGETRFTGGGLQLPPRQRSRRRNWLADLGWAAFAALSLGSAGSLAVGWHKEEAEGPKYMSADNPWSLASGADERERAATQAVESSVYYSGCNEARAAGAAPIFSGQPGYREGMDGDGDGIACEPIS